MSRFMHLIKCGKKQSDSDVDLSFFFKQEVFFYVYGS